MLSQALYHHHAQFALARHDLADTTSRAQMWHKIGSVKSCCSIRQVSKSGNGALRGHQRCGEIT